MPRAANIPLRALAGRPPAAHHQQPKPCRLAIEAVGFCEWFIDRFRPCVARMDIADATALASLRGKRRKNDRNDAIAIAYQ